MEIVSSELWIAWILWDWWIDTQQCMLYVKWKSFNVLNNVSEIIEKQNLLHSILDNWFDLDKYYKILLIQFLSDGKISRDEIFNVFMKRLKNCWGEDGLSEDENLLQESIDFYIEEVWEYNAQQLIDKALYDFINTKIASIFNSLWSDDLNKNEVWINLNGPWHVLFQLKDWVYCSKNIINVSWEYRIVK